LQFSPDFSAVLFALLLTYREVPSPDGEFVAIAKASLFFFARSGDA
jgi:hypothetical protein